MYSLMSTATTMTLAMHEPTIVSAASFEISVLDVGATVFVGSLVCDVLGCGVTGLSVGMAFVVGLGVGVAGCAVCVG
jgi:hypothetical protein